MNSNFEALFVRENENGFSANVETLSISDLPKNDLLIKVSYSSVNFKDVMSASGNKGVTQKFPHVPGIDAVGEVIAIASDVDSFKAGAKILVTGYDLGMNTWGGFGEYISIPAKWAIPLPEKLLPLEAMSYGTAGLTAGLSVYELLKNGLKPENGKIIVSGATGGVGSLSIAILAKLGYDVVAITGKNQDDFLVKTLGAKSVISRQEFVEKYDSKSLSSTEFAGGIDAVGGNILSGMLKATQYNGAVTCCGLVASTELNTSILPFILRHVKLIGIDSVEQPLAYKEEIWKLLADEWKPSVLTKIIQEIELRQLPDALKTVLEGKTVGRYVVKHQ